MNCLCLYTLDNADRCAGVWHLALNLARRLMHIVCMSRCCFTADGALLWGLPLRAMQTRVQASGQGHGDVTLLLISWLIARSRTLTLHTTTWPPPCTVKVGLFLFLVLCFISLHLLLLLLTCRVRLPESSGWLDSAPSVPSLIVSRLKVHNWDCACL